MMTTRRRIAPTVLLALAALAVSGHGERHVPVRWALLVGVSDYVHFDDEPGGDLPGAANDARGMREVLLARWGFAEANMRMLLDHDATRAAIESALTEWLPSVASAGDVVVFFYAGHGSQMWDADGDEEDGLDETICPTDVTSGSTNRDIPDDELREWLDALPTDRVTVILDSCHSGTATRAALSTVRTRALARNVRTDVPRPPGTRGVAAPDTTDPAAASMDLAEENVLEIAAAQADESALDVPWPGERAGEATWGGVFTTNFVRALWQMPTTATYEQVFDRAVESVREQRYEQTPRLSPGHPLRDLPAFTAPGLFAFGTGVVPDAAGGAGGNADAAASAGGGDADALPDAAAAAAAVPIVELPTDGSAVLGGGRAAGMTEGSLYRAGGTLLRVSAVEPERARADVVSRGTRGIVVARRDTFAVGGYARLAAYRYPATALHVEASGLPATARTSLMDAVASTPAVVVLDDPAATAADLVLRADGGVYRVLGVDGAVRHAVAAPDATTGAAALVPVLRKELGASRLATESSSWARASTRPSGSVRPSTTLAGPTATTSSAGCTARRSTPTRSRICSPADTCTRSARSARWRCCSCSPCRSWP